jgi:hypothetical protein
MSTELALLTAQQLSDTYGDEYCLDHTEDHEPATEPDEPAADTYFECPPPSAKELAEDYGYDLPLCRAYLSSCLDQSDPVEPTEQGLHAFALDSLQAEHESSEERRELEAREDRS